MIIIKVQQKRRLIRLGSLGFNKSPWSSTVCLFFCSLDWLTSGVKPAQGQLRHWQTTQPILSLISNPLHQWAHDWQNLREAKQIPWNSFQT